MRIAVYGGSTWQKKHSKNFARWYIHNYIPKNIRHKLDISICLYHNLKTWKNVATDTKDLAYCEYIEEDKSPINEHCKITLYSPENLLYYKFLTRLAHEFVHVKQYVTHELKYHSNFTVFKKQKIEEDSTDYWNLPYEIEAMGHEYGLVKLYCEEAKIKHEVFTTKVKRIIC